MGHQLQGEPPLHKSAEHGECWSVRSEEVEVWVSGLREGSRSHLRILWCSGKASTGSVGKWAVMAPRQRPFSRRGTGRRGASRPPVNPSSSCCRCLCHRVEEANPIQTQQFMDVGPQELGAAPLPAFGSAIFSFSNAQGNSSIQAHVSVLFMEEAKEEGGEQPNAPMHHAGG